MGFINFPSPTPVFPVLAPQTYSQNKMPSFGGQVSTAASGRECQLTRQVYPRWEFTLRFGGDAWLREQTQNITPYAPLTGRTEFETISGLFLACRGMYGEFYYDDPEDDSRLGFLAGVGNGVQTIFPLFYTWGTGPFSPVFTAPVSGIKSIDAVYFNGVRQFSGFAPDATNTAVQFTSPPGIPSLSGPNITVDFHFYFRCHFLADLEEYEQWAKNLWEQKELKFQSVKP